MSRRRQLGGTGPIVAAPSTLFLHLDACPRVTRTADFVWKLILGSLDNEP